MTRTYKKGKDYTFGLYIEPHNALRKRIASRRRNQTHIENVVTLGKNYQFKAG